MGPIVLLALSIFGVDAKAANRSTHCNPPSLCQAYWTGAEYVEKGGIAGSCVAMSASGCSNPFSYGSTEDCMRAHGLSDGPTCKAFWVGWEFNAREGRCQRVTASGCRNPFRFHSEQQCVRFHPELTCLGEK